MEAWQWILTVCGAISTIGGTAALIYKWIKPIRDHAKRVETLERQNRRDMERFEAISVQLEQARQANQAVYKALMSIMNHMVDGNSVENLKAARKELSKFIIEH